MYDIFEKLMEERGVKTVDVCRGTGISSATFADWKAGRTQPKADKLLRIAKFFGVPMEYLMTGEMPNEEHYYVDPETRRIAEELRTNHELKLLFDAGKDATPEGLLAAHQVLLALKRKEEHLDDD